MTTIRVVRVPVGKARVVLQPPKAKRAKFPYQGFIDFLGLEIDVENAAGSTRSGTGADGKPWTTKMAYHYGEIRGTEGTDGDKLDCYVGPWADSPLVVVVHQQEPTTRKFDEDKVMLGFLTVQEALAAYRSQYDRPGFYQSHDVLAIGEFWRWVSDRGKKGKKVRSGAR